MTGNDVLKINYFVYSHQSKFEKLGRREWNTYCHADYGYEYRTDTFEYGHNERYKAVNLVNGSKVEFRFFKGTLKVSTIKASICLVAALCEIVPQMTWEEVKSNESFDNFVRTIKADKKLTTLSTYLRKKGF